jgi:hypothetical protein
VPADCTVVVVAGREGLFAPADAAPLREGRRQRRCCWSPTCQVVSRLVALAGEWNLTVGNDVVVGRSGMGQIVGGGPFAPVVMSYPFHEITKDLREVMTVFHTARSVQAGTGGAPGIVAQGIGDTFDVLGRDGPLAQGKVRFDEPGSSRAHLAGRGGHAERRRARPSARRSPGHRPWPRWAR